MQPTCLQALKGVQRAGGATFGRRALYDGRPARDGVEAVRGGLVALGERCRAGGVSVVVHRRFIGSERNQELHDLRMAPVGSKDQRGRPIVGPCQVWVGRPRPIQQQPGNL